MKFNFFRVKTKLQMQIEEYLEWKAKFSSFTAEAHKEILKDFTSLNKFKDISEITLNTIQNYYETHRTFFSKTKAMQAIRGFMRYFWGHKQHNINPAAITNEGVIYLQSVAQNAIVTPMIKKKRVGRPNNVALIKEVQTMIDKAGLGVVEVAKILKDRRTLKTVNKGYVSRLYRRDLSKIVA